MVRSFEDLRKLRLKIVDKLIKDLDDLWDNTDNKSMRRTAKYVDTRIALDQNALNLDILLTKTWDLRNLLESKLTGEDE